MVLCFPEVFGTSILSVVTQLLKIDHCRISVLPLMSPPCLTHLQKATSDRCRRVPQQRGFHGALCVSENCDSTC